MFNEKFHRAVKLFGAMHGVTLLVMLALIVLLIAFRRKFTPGSSADKGFRYGVASVMVALEAGFLIWSGLRRDFIPLIPLELCSIMLWTSAAAAFFDKPAIIRITFFWSVIGATLPFFIITIGYVFPHFRFLHYFAIHFCILVLNLYPVVTKRIVLRYRDVLLSIGVLLALGGAVYPVNRALGTNFMFLMGLPGGLKAFSDRLGPVGYLPLLAATAVVGLHAIYGLYRLALSVAEAVQRRQVRHFLSRQNLPS